MDKNYFDILIIGGGASGLAAAVTASRYAKDKTIGILEKKSEVGLKLKAAGNGRCNISNINCKEQELVHEFLEYCGIFLRQEEDRIYPFSEDGKQVVEALRNTAVRQGVVLRVDFEVAKVEKTCSGAFILESTKGEVLCCEKLLIATGGKSYSNFGTTGDGYIWAKILGHRVERLIPALTPIEVMENIKSLKGLRCKAKVTLNINGRDVSEEIGEVQFREDSLSGICIMNLSLLVRREDEAVLKLDFFAENEDLEVSLNRRMALDNLRIEEIFTTLVKKPLAEYILVKMGLNGKSLIKELSDRDIDNVLGELRSMNFKVKGLKGWNEAQLTAGGISLKDINSRTGESKILSNLYFSGEVLDYQGICGGYNLHQAWVSGIKAGKGMAKCIE